MDVLIDVAEGLSNCVTSLVSTSCMGNVLGTGTALSVGIEPTSITQNDRTVYVSSGIFLQYFKDQVWIYVAKYIVTNIAFGVKEIELKRTLRTKI